MATERNVNRLIVTPRATVFEFMRLVGQQDWEGARSLTTHTWRSKRPLPGFWRSVWRKVTRKPPEERTADDLMAILWPLHITGVMKVSETKRISDLMVDVPAVVQTKAGARRLIVRLVCESGPMRLDKDGTWGVVPVSCLRGARK